jgi:FkbM family methyltransferase
MPLVRDACARLAESNPYFWKLAWESLHWFPMLLPHDRSYNALRHFITLKPNGLFLDVGANDGISTLSFRRFDREYRIFAVEPNPFLEPALRRIKLKDRNFDYMIGAAGYQASRMTLSVPIFRGIAFHTFTSDDQAKIAVAIENAFGARVAGATRMRSFETKVLPLDELELEPTIIKVDAEGFDFQILKGLTTTIERSRPFIMAEVAVADIADIGEFFAARNYHVLGYDIELDRFTGGPISSNQLASGHRNFFAVPDEFLKFLELENPRPETATW